MYHVGGDVHKQQRRKLSHGEELRRLSPGASMGHVVNMGHRARHPWGRRRHSNEKIDKNAYLCGANIPMVVLDDLYDSMALWYRLRCRVISSHLNHHLEIINWFKSHETIKHVLL